MENQTEIIYSPDYRSPPSGLGTISIGDASADPYKNRTLAQAPQHLFLGMGVELRRFKNATQNTTPVVRLAGYEYL